LNLSTPLTKKCLAKNASQGETNTAMETWPATRFFKKVTAKVLVLSANTAHVKPMLTANCHWEQNEGLAENEGLKCANSQHFKDSVCQEPTLQFDTHGALVQLLPSKLFVHKPVHNPNNVNLLIPCRCHT